MASFEIEREWLNWFGLAARSSGAFSQHAIYTLVEGAGQGRGRKNDMVTTDRE